MNVTAIVVGVLISFLIILAVVIVATIILIVVFKRARQSNKSEGNC